MSTKRSLRLWIWTVAVFATALLAQVDAFSGVRIPVRSPSSTPTTVAAQAAALAPTQSPTKLAATSAAALSTEKPPRRKFFRSVRKAVVGVVTASAIREQLATRRKNAAARSSETDADANTITTTGNIIQLQVGNLDGSDSQRQGTIKIQLYPEWAPIGAKRFEELVRETFFDDSRVFRVVPGVLAQFGIHGDPAIQAKWRSAVISEDPVRVSNTRGTLFFCKSAPGPTSTGRTSQVAINTNNNLFLDDAGFAPFGRVIEGMDLVDRFFAGYHGNEPEQGMIQAKGNDYLRSNFPKLSFISKANVVAKADNLQEESM